ncbi:hypothetical protein BDP27DRAFT_1449023 [Rhodocollybia butyracea]|uniref:Uncharacterized protein n=1 Tax=Rhodocollybia butyracea TaxID=206335 RepID=A0A9P5PQD1_9AGAR|nr:hypothetical protein BDP27DRAFT_1449023 [Rhodocollybia butyracea]
MSIHFCAQAFLPVEKAWDAVEGALKENPNNAGNSFGSPLSPAGGITPAAALATPAPDALWPSVFTPYVQSKIREYAAVWEQYANIHFDFVDDRLAEIRISFNLADGSWSYLGTDALLRRADQATMKLWMV